MIPAKPNAIKRNEVTNLGKTKNAYRQRFKTIRERFEDYVKRTDTCWVWLGHNCPDGYGRFWINRKGIQAHRAAWIIYRSEIPVGFIVCHNCDMRNCVNPDHLFLGTHKENTQDMMRKNRHLPCLEAHKGERSCFAKLTAQQALEVYNAKGTQSEIGEVYGITQTAVGLIKRGVNWGWLTQGGRS